MATNLSASISFSRPSSIWNRGSIVAGHHGGPCPFPALPTMCGTALRVQRDVSDTAGYHDRERIVADLRAGGFATIEVDVVDLEAQAASAQEVAMGLVQGSPMVEQIRHYGRATVDEVTAAVAEALAREFGAAPLRGPMRALAVHAR